MRETLILFVCFSIFILNSGCGETVKGASKDAHRIGKGVKTVFVSDDE